MSALPTVAEIEADFALLDDWEDRYRYVIELGRKLPPLAEAEVIAANKVQGCASQVWLVTEPAHDGDTLVVRGMSDAHIVSGLMAILIAQLTGRPPAEILHAQPQALFARLGLAEHLTPQRSNGLAAMIARIESDARALAQPSIAGR